MTKNTKIKAKSATIIYRNSIQHANATDSRNLITEVLAQRLAKGKKKNKTKFAPKTHLHKQYENFEASPKVYNGYHSQTKLFGSFKAQIPHHLYINMYAQKSNTIQNLTSKFAGNASC